jgi:hypothetical protein
MPLHYRDAWFGEDGLSDASLEAIRKRKQKQRKNHLH